MGSEPSEDNEIGLNAEMDSMSKGNSGSVEGEGEANEHGGVPQRLPQPAVGRLSLYYRELRRLLDEGEASLNSQALGRLVNVSPAVPSSPSAS